MAAETINLEEYIRISEIVERLLDDLDAIIISKDRFNAYSKELCSKPNGWWKDFLKEVFKQAYGLDYPNDFNDNMTPELRKEMSNPNHLGSGWDYESHPSLKALRIRTAKALRKLLLGRWEVLELLEPPEIFLLMKLWCDINILL